MTVLALALARRAPYLVVGWLWFVGTLVPVIGLVQVGSQAMADRYTYVPLVGLFVAGVWGATNATAGWRWPRLALGLGGGSLLAACFVGYCRGPWFQRPASPPLSYWFRLLCSVRHGRTHFP